MKVHSYVWMHLFCRVYNTVVPTLIINAIIYHILSVLCLLSYQLPWVILCYRHPRRKNNSDTIQVIFNNRLLRELFLYTRFIVFRLDGLSFRLRFVVANPWGLRTHIFLSTHIILWISVVIIKAWLLFDSLESSN